MNGRLFRWLRCRAIAVWAIWIPAMGAIGVENMPLIRSIDVEHQGEVTVATERILANLELKVGQPFSQGVASDDVKVLYTLGAFEDIRILAEPVEDAENGVAVVVRVRGRSMMQSIQFEGNTLLSDEKLKSSARLRSGAAADQADLQSARGRIVEAYK